MASAFILALVLLAPSGAGEPCGETNSLGGLALRLGPRPNRPQLLTRRGAGREGDPDNASLSTMWAQGGCPGVRSASRREF